MGTITEFGQSMFAKSGFLASKVEWRKGPAEKPIIITHIGADCCPRQVYTVEHVRRVECYQADGNEFSNADWEKTIPFAVAGPLCFQGDFVGKDLPLPERLAAGDLVVVKDTGANSISMFSRHCSRFCPPVFGYRCGGTDQVTEWVELKPRETPEELSGFWGQL